MNTKNLGIILLVIGILMIIYTGFTYFTTEKVVDIGRIEIDKQKSHPIHWSPIIGCILFVVGLLTFNMNKKA